MVGDTREARHPTPPTFPPPAPAPPRQGLKTKHGKEKGKKSDRQKLVRRERTDLRAVSLGWNARAIQKGSPTTALIRDTARDPSAHFSNDQIGMLSRPFVIANRQQPPSRPGFTHNFVPPVLIAYPCKYKPALERFYRHRRLMSLPRCEDCRRRN